MISERSAGVRRTVFAVDINLAVEEKADARIMLIDSVIAEFQYPQPKNPNRPLYRPSPRLWGTSMRCMMNGRAIDQIHR